MPRPRNSTDTATLATPPIGTDRPPKYWASGCTVSNPARRPSTSTPSEPPRSMRCARDPALDVVERVGERVRPHDHGGLDVVGHQLAHLEVGHGARLRTCRHDFG